MKAHCITLRSTPWRENFARAELMSHGVQPVFFYGFDGSKIGLRPDLQQVPGQTMKVGHMATALSHLALWRALLARDEEHFLIFEDDSVLCDDFQSRLMHALLSAPDDWDMLYLGRFGGREIRKVNHLWAQFERPTGTFAYMVTRRALEVLVDENQFIATHIDSQITWTSHPKLNVYCSSEQMVTQKGFMSLTGTKRPARQCFAYRDFVLSNYKARAHSAGYGDLKEIYAPLAEPYVIEKKISGARFDLIVGNDNARKWYDIRGKSPVQRENWTELAFIRKNIIQRGMRVFDVGAHQGFYSMCFAAWVGGKGSVLAFEPMPWNCDLLTFNAHLNDATNLSIAPYAAGAARGSVTFDEPFNTGSVSLEVRPLDDYADRRPDFLKIDAEGAECEILRGAKRILETTPHLAIEVHEFIIGQSGVRELESLVDWSRYNCTYVLRDGSFVPWQPGAPINHLTTLYAKRK